jgi:hypothetical protein
VNGALCAKWTLVPPSAQQLDVVRVRTLPVKKPV